MSRQSQAKRAARAKERAKQRSRDKQRSGRTAPSEPGPFGGSATFGDDPSSPFVRPGPPLAHGAREILEGVRHGIAVGMVLPEAMRIDPAIFHRETEKALVAWVRELYGEGWQPTELIRFARIRNKAAAAELIRLAITVERDQRQGPTASDPRWEQQWDAADLPTRIESRAWAERWAASVPGGGSVKEILRLAMALGLAPTLELLLPPPPGVRVRKPLAGRPTGAAVDPVLTRVRALLAKAESTDYEAEAMSYTAKAQELMTRHAIDLATVEGADGGRPGTPHLIRIPLDTPYLDAKALLLQTVAGQTRCRTVHHQDLAMSSVVGFATDLEAVELLFTSLLVQAQHGLAEASATAPPGSRTRSQAFRAAFLQGFTGRIAERLAEVNRLAYADAGGDSFLPVLRSQDERIEDFVDQHFGDTIEGRVRGGYDPLGYAHGELAGDTAALTSGAVQDSRA